MPYVQPAPSNPDDPDAYERLSVLARYAVEHNEVQAVRSLVADAAVFDQFCAVHAHRAAGEQARQVELLAEAEYRKLLGRDEARRRMQEAAAVERGHVSSRILTYADACALPPPAQLVPNVIYTGAVGVILGDSQVGKSWVMLSLAAAAATGMPWPPGGKDVERRTPMPVLYVSAEDGATVTARLQQWEHAHGRQLGADAVVFHIHPAAINLLDDIQIDELCETVAERNYMFIVFDTVAASLGGEEEGNPQFSKVVQNMRRVLVATSGQGGVFLVHHFGKDKTRGARGGSSLFNDSDVFWELHGSRDAMVMKNTKWKTGKERYPWRLRLDESDEATVCIKADTSAASISVGPAEDKYSALSVAILKVIGERAADNQGFGPSRSVIKDCVSERGARFRDVELSQRLERMVADRRLYVQSGPGRAMWYRMPSEQQQIPDLDI